jgi:hypothetical protein
MRSTCHVASRSRHRRDVVSASRSRHAQHEHEHEGLVQSQVLLLLRGSFCARETSSSSSRKG